MDALSFSGRAGIAWTVALLAGLLTGHLPFLGLALGTLGWAFTLWRRRLPRAVLLAALGTIAIAAVLPGAALAEDPFHARQASGAWPIVAGSWAILGGGAATWTWMGTRSPLRCHRRFWPRRSCGGRC